MSHTTRGPSPQAQINEPIDPKNYVYEVWLRGFGFEASFPESLNRQQLERYNRDPDLFAAQHFGFDTVEQYREWVTCEGLAYCSERTKSGRPCKWINHPMGPLSAREWRERHRRIPCTLHVNKMQEVQS